MFFVKVVKKVDPKSSYYRKKMLFSILFILCLHEMRDSH